MRSTQALPDPPKHAWTHTLCNVLQRNTFRLSILTILQQWRTSRGNKTKRRHRGARVWMFHWHCTFTLQSLNSATCKRRWLTGSSCVVLHTRWLSQMSLLPCFVCSKWMPQLSWGRLSLLEWNRDLMKWDSFVLLMCFCLVAFSFSQIIYHLN